MEGTFDVTIPSAHLPATVLRILVQPGDRVSKTQALIRYRYTRSALETRRDEDDDNEVQEWVPFATVEELRCPVVGVVERVLVGEQDEVRSSRPVLAIKEPCTHPVNYGGLCAICGVDVTTTDFTGTSDAQRATINMSHTVARLNVSRTEAERLEGETARRLREAKKLSLVVDLDQTIIHATVDPTVGEWMADKTTASNPAVKEIRELTLDGNPTIYYVKTRPGLQHFLEEVSKKYELHIYTMGTRSYAEKVAQLVDPTGKYFGDRVLSRDESGSITQKAIHRLFPCDDSMVVVIDDRADVWDHSPNVVRVVPCQ